MTTHHLAPTLSVVMSVYNAAPYLEEAVESILGQTFQDYEFIIINDGSNDGSLELLRRFEKKDSRIKLVSRENKGFIKSLVEGISHAQGRYIARMDADDIALPTRFQQQLAFMENNPQVVCIGGNIEHIDEKSRVITHIKYPEDNDDIQTRLVRGHSTICHPASLFRSSAYLQVGGYRDDCFPAEDLDLWLRLGEVGELANLKDIVLRYRLLDNSISGSKRTEQRKAAELACKLAWERRGIPGTFHAQQHWRPDTNDSSSQLEFYLKFGWQARNYNQKRTAAIYALKGLRVGFTDRRPWMLLISVLRPLKQ